MGGQISIRRVQEKARVIRHQLEENIKRKLPESSPIFAWLARWAAELLTKYSCGDDGKSPDERLYGEKCVTPLVQFGESLFYLPLKTMKRDKKGDVAQRPGIWLGVIARTQETLIGTDVGVVKCRTVNRLPDNERWNAKQVLCMKGAPWEPVPGKADRRVPVAIDSRGNGVQPTDEDEVQEHDPEIGCEGHEVQLRGGPDKLHVSKTAIEAYGPTEGCPACNVIKRRGMSPGKIGVHHSNQC